MRRYGKKVQFIYICIMLLLIASAFVSATYAWFSSNRIVSTDSVSGRSGTDTVRLLISRDGGSSFRGDEQASIVQVNQTVLTQLMPVSTADLKTFVYNTNSSGNNAVSFDKVENEQYYYHGRVYLQALAKDQPANARLALYLDQGTDAGGSLLQKADGYILNAARLGVTFGGGSPVIFRLSESGNPQKEQINNTILDGRLLRAGQVLDGSSGRVRAVSDPSVALSGYTINTDDASVLPSSALFTMELNRIYPVDIFFYLEGCDPDCSDSIQYNGVNLHLAFYGVLTEGNG